MNRKIAVIAERLLNSSKAWIDELQQDVRGRILFWLAVIAVAIIVVVILNRSRKVKS